MEEHDSKQGKVEKEYLFIVTDYLPYTVCDLRVANQPPDLALEAIKQVMEGLF